MSETVKEVFQAWELLEKAASAGAVVGVWMTLTDEAWAQRRAPQGFWIRCTNPTAGAEAGRGQALRALITQQRTQAHTALRRWETPGSISQIIGPHDSLCTDVFDPYRNLGKRSYAPTTPVPPV